MTPTDHEYGYSHALRSFDGIISFRDDTLRFRNKVIPWASVVGYRSYPDFWGDKLFMSIKSAQPRLSIYLADGSLLKVRGELLRKKGESAAVVDGLPSAYIEIVDELQRRRIPEWRGPAEEYVLFRTATALGWVGAIAGFAAMLALPIGQVERIALALFAGVVAANLSFLVSPYFATKLRRNYISHSVHSSL